MWIGMRWTVRDILYYSVDFLSQGRHKSSTTKWETYKDPWPHNEVVFDEDATQRGRKHGTPSFVRTNKMRFTFLIMGILSLLGSGYERYRDVSLKNGQFDLRLLVSWLLKPFLSCSQNRFLTTWSRNLDCNQTPLPSPIPQTVTKKKNEKLTQVTHLTCGWNHITSWRGSSCEYDTPLLELRHRVSRWRIYSLSHPMKSTPSVNG